MVASGCSLWACRKDIPGWWPRAAAGPLQKWERLTQENTLSGPNFLLGAVLVCYSVHLDRQSKHTKSPPTLKLTSLNWSAMSRWPLLGSVHSRGGVFARTQVLLPGVLSLQLLRACSFDGHPTTIQLPFSKVLSFFDL